MTAYDIRAFTTGKQTCGVHSDKIYTQTKTIDFSKGYVDLASTNMPEGVGTLYASSDTIKIFTIPKGSQLLNVAYEVLTAEGAAATFDLGDSGTANKFFNDANMNAAAGTLAAYTTTEFFTSEDYVVLLLNSASVDKAVIKFALTLVAPLD